MFWISSRPHWTEDVRLNPDNQSGSITEPVSNCPQAPGPNMVWAQPTDDKGKASGLKGLDKDGKEHELEILDKEEQSQIPLMILLILHNLSSAGEPDPEDPVEWVAFQRLMERPWWRRVWVIQEVAAASNSIWVGCGAK
jgi:Heterokaryon incompatibility protein (HET)